MNQRNQEGIPRYSSPEWQVRAYGCLESELAQSKPEFISPLMYSLMILSDAQEENGNNTERVRQYINKAKFFIGGVMGEEKNT